MPNPPLIGERLEAYLDAHIERIPEDTCWEWTGTIGSDGYGRFMSQYRNRSAHRAVWELRRGPVPEGLQLDHLCRNRACVNPDHLEPVTGWENLMRGTTLAAANVAKDRCKRGHAFTEANTYHHAARRHCRACRKQADRERNGR